MSGYTTLIEIEFDIDGYLASGGNLLDLMVAPSPVEKMYLDGWLRAGNAVRPVGDRIARLGRFLGLVVQQIPPGVTGRDHLSEAQLQALWRTTT